MKSAIKFFVILVAVMLLSAVLAPLLVHFLPFKFEKIFNRLVMIFSLAAVILFVRIRRETFARYGLLWHSDSLSLLTKTFGVSVLALSVLCALYIASGLAKWSPGPFKSGEFVSDFFSALGSAFVIGIIEEFFFRGFIYTSLRERFGAGLVGGIVLTNIFYSLLHFVSKKKPLIGSDPTFWDSLRLLKAPFASFGDWQTLWPAALGLFLFGLILNILFVRSKSLWPSVGFHAGCVFFIKLDRVFVDFLSRNPLMTGSSRLYDGALGWAFLVLLGFVLNGIVSRGICIRGKTAP